MAKKSTGWKFTTVFENIHVFGPCHLFTPLRRVGGNKTQGSNTIMSTSFALKFCFNKIIDVDTIVSITLTVS